MNLSERRKLQLSPLTSTACKDSSSKTVTVPSLTEEYELLEIVGKGGYAVVKRAMRKHDDTVVAVKISHCPDHELRMTALVA